MFGSENFSSKEHNEQNMGWSKTEQKGKLFKNEKIYIGSKFIVASYLEKITFFCWEIQNHLKVNSERLYIT